MMVSLVIPVYNVEKFLGKCLQSVVEQTYQNLEVIIVDDGSTDGSSNIINNFSAKYDKIDTFRIKNGGVGNARNFGVKKSKGEYICFLDSDDYMEKTCVEKLVNTIKKYDSDIAICNNYDVDEYGNILAEYRNTYSTNPVSLLQDPTILFNRICPWGKLYKRELFEGLEFVSREIAEDMRLIPKLYLRAKSISYCDESLIYYVQRQNSLINSSSVNKNLHLINAFKDLNSYFQEQGVYENVKDALHYLMIDHIAIAGITRAVLANSEDSKNVIKALNEYLSCFGDIYANPYKKRESLQRRIILFLNRKKLYFLTGILMKLKKKL